MIQMLMVWATATVGSTVPLTNHGKAELKQHEGAQAQLFLLTDSFLTEEVEEEDSESHHDLFTLHLCSNHTFKPVFQNLSRLYFGSALSTSQGCPIYLFTGKLLI